MDEGKIPEILMPPELMKKCLISDHQNIRLSPYDPRAWLGRAGTLLCLGYGDLAISDAYRALILVEIILQLLELKKGNHDADLQDPIASKVFSAVTARDHMKKDDLQMDLDEKFDIIKSFEHDTFIIMATGLLRMTAFYDGVKVLEEAQKRFPTSKVIMTLLVTMLTRLQQLEEECIDKLKSAEYIQREVTRGRVRKVAYPWIVPGEYTRSKNAIKKVKASFRSASANSEIASAPQDDDSINAYGVFAREDILKGTRLLSDMSVYSATNVYNGQFCAACCGPINDGRVSMDCCDAIFCSSGCQKDAMNNYHRILCGKDFTWMEDPSKKATGEFSHALVPSLMLKILATAVQQNTKPLRVTCVNTLDAGLGKVALSSFTFFENVAAPSKILQSLGVDIFADVRFDTWILQMLFLRLENNKQGSQTGKQIWCGLNPLFTMFNHDCDPAANWYASNKTGGGPLKVRAIRDIKKGDQIFVSYVDVSFTEEARRKSVQLYIGKICECTRCLREREDAAEGMNVTASDITAVADGVMSELTLNSSG
ncbi:MAG: hypothetical protein Q9195_004344 [Heterodermia aff. obscurata]